MAHTTVLRSAAILAFSLLCLRATAQDAASGSAAGTDMPQNTAGVDLRFNSGSRLFPDPYSRDPVAKNATNDLGDFLSFSAHYGRQVTGAIRVRLAGEYISHDHITTDNYGTETSDGFRMYGVELLGLFQLPFSAGDFRFYAGGGGGFVYGYRQYSIAGIEARSLRNALAFGIHVLFGIDYSLSESLSLCAEFHFRDPQIAVQNAFDQDQVFTNGVTYRLPTEPFDSKINLNGNVYSIGAVWRW